MQSYDYLCKMKPTGKKDSPPKNECMEHFISILCTIFREPALMEKRSIELVIQALNGHQVRYLVAGGLALRALHGRCRSFVVYGRLD